MRKSSENLSEQKLQLRTVKYTITDYSRIYGRGRQSISESLRRGEVPQVLHAGTSEIEIWDRINRRKRQMLPTVPKEGTLKIKSYAGSWVPTEFISDSVYIEELELDRPYPYAVFKGNKGWYKMRFSWIGPPSYTFRS
jgi:hypothetical protein